MRRLLALGMAGALAGCAVLVKPPPQDAVPADASAASKPAGGAHGAKSPPAAARPATGAASAAPLPATTTLDTAAIEEASGLTGAVMPDGVFRITKPRGDLKVTLDGFPITPRMGLAGWAAFQPHASGALLIGRMPVAADELQGVVSALANAGLETTMLHGHFVGEEPRVRFVHFLGLGNPVALARGVRDVHEAIVRVRAARPFKTAAVEARSDLDASHLDVLLGQRGEYENGVYRATIARSDLAVSELGIPLGPTMRPTSWVALQGTAERAAVAGELMIAPNELQPVVHALRASRVGVVAVHDGSSRTEPRLVCVSFWGVGRADALAAGVRKALDTLPRGG